MRGALTLLTCLLVAGCSGVEVKPGDKPHARRDIKPGAGLFSGAQGEFVLYRKKASDTAQEPAIKP